MTPYFLAYQQILVVLYICGLVRGLISQYASHMKPPQNQTTSASKTTGL